MSVAQLPSGWYTRLIYVRRNGRATRHRGYSNAEPHVQYVCAGACAYIRMLNLSAWIAQLVHTSADSREKEKEKERVDERAFIPRLEKTIPTIPCTRPVERTASNLKAKGAKEVSLYRRCFKFAISIVLPARQPVRRYHRQQSTRMLRVSPQLGQGSISRSFISTRSSIIVTLENIPVQVLFVN